MSNTKNIDVSLLMKVSGVKQEKDEFTNLLQSDNDFSVSELGKALAEANEAARKSALKDAVESIRNLLSLAADVKNIKVNSVREMRRRTNAEIAKIKEIDRAYQYALETNNFLPLFRQVVPNEPGSVSQAFIYNSAASELANVPANWKPKAAKKT